MIDEKIIKKVVDLRQKLHLSPEISGNEKETKKLLMEFIQNNSTCEIVDMGNFFYCIHKEENANETIGFRADFDAILNSEGVAFHGCGHDGHSAILCGLILSLENVKTNKNIIFLFQHAEENGTGAKECKEILKPLNVSRFYGLHNYPNLNLNEVYTSYDTIMCASKGLTIDFEGTQSHASEPENGNNPAYAIGKLIEDVKELSSFQGYGTNYWKNIEFNSMILATIVNVSVGEKDAFGISPGIGSISLTLRAKLSSDLDKLTKELLTLVDTYAKENNLKFNYKFTDEFPDTTNNKKEVERLKNILKNTNIKFNILKEPMRPSEDFGWYTKTVPCCFFFIGDGKHLPLHNDEYTFPDEIIERSIEVFNLIATKKED